MACTQAAAGCGCRCEQAGEGRRKKLDRCWVRRAVVDASIELGIAPGSARRMPLADLNLLAARIRQRTKLEDLKTDARFMGICRAVMAASGLAESFDPAVFFWSLK